MRVFDGFDELKSAVGTEVGVSDWIEMTQDRINRFAEATCDEQWIHIDQERAKAEIPGGKTIAHGLLSLSLTPMFMRSVIGLKGMKKHTELRRRPHPLSGAGAGRFAAARPREHSRSGGRSAQRLAGQLSRDDRDRRRQASSLRRRADRPALSLRRPARFNR